MKIRIIAVFFLCFGICGQVHAQYLHSFQRAGGDYSELTATTMNILNLDGSVYLAAGPTGVGQITAAAFDPTTGYLYTTHGGGGCCPVTGIAGCLLTTDADTGATTILACDSEYQGNDNMPGLAVNSLGEMYGMLLTCNAGPMDCNIYLVSVNKTTGDLTLIGQTGEWDEGNGIGFGAGDVLYFQDLEQGFGSVNLATGAFNPIGETFLGFPADAEDFRMTDATYDADNNVFYAAVAYDNGTTVTSLATVDTATGAFTFVNTLPPRTASIAFGSGVLPSVARFKVTKTFSDNSTDDVDVTLTCTTGSPLTQTATITGGDSIGVTFVVTNLEGSVDCEVTETGSPAGYAPIYNGGEGCSWTEAVESDNTCAISNAAKPASFTANMEWIVLHEGGDVVDQNVPVTITCNSAISGGTQAGDLWNLASVLGDGTQITATVDTTSGSASCWASQNVSVSGVESSDDCGERTIAAGTSSSCTFVNTLFFEGVPALSSYGKALLIVLLLGVGFIGMRRFS